MSKLLFTLFKNISAAHCVTNIVRSGDAIYVRVGDYDLTRKFGSPGAQTLRVATTYIHHNHNSQTLDNDIALLKLHGQAELRDGVCLVRFFLHFFGSTFLFSIFLILGLFTSSRS